MEKYDLISVVGEGSYGLVMRCRHRETGQHVAIKKFLETDDDLTVKKMAVREIRMLRKLRHENLVSLLDVFRRKKRFFLVFEYVEHTVLEELEAHAGGLGFIVSRKHIYQVLRALDFIHAHNVIHRDIKPENVLVSRLGVVKLCDFGFARHYDENETFTDYVATRWYRSPELLVGDTRYGKEVDIWAVGCLYAEMMNGEPLFPGESDIDQLFQIVRVLGKPNCRHQILITRNAMFKGMKQEQNSSLVQLFPDWSRDGLDFVTQCLRMDTIARPDAATLLKHDLFTRDDFLEFFLPELRAKINQEQQGNPLLRRASNVELKKTEEKQKLPSSGPKRISDIDLSKQKEKRQIGLTLAPQNTQPPISLHSLYSQQPKETLQRTSLSYSNENLTQQKKPVAAPPAVTTTKQGALFAIGASETEKTERLLSPKPSAPRLHTHNLLAESQFHTSPVRFQSLQSEETSAAAAAVSTLKVSPMNGNHFLHYFKKNLTSTLDPKHLIAGGGGGGGGGSGTAVSKHSPIGAKLGSSHKASLVKRDRGLPLTLANAVIANANAELSKEVDVRLLPPPWLASSNPKVSSNERVAQMNKRMTDWKTMHSEKTRLSVGDAENIQLPSCPGASLSPKNSQNNRKKLTPIVNSPEFNTAINHHSN